MNECTMPTKTYRLEFKTHEGICRYTGGSFVITDTDARLPTCRITSRPCQGDLDERPTHCRLVEIDE